MTGREMTMDTKLMYFIRLLKGGVIHATCTPLLKGGGRLKSHNTFQLKGKGELKSNFLCSFPNLMIKRIMLVFLNVVLKYT